MKKQTSRSSLLLCSSKQQQQQFLSSKNLFERRSCGVQNLWQPRIFATLLAMLDFTSLFTLMQTRRDYRWDVDKRGKGYQPNQYWVHKVIRKRMKQVLLADGGLRSTVERRKLWIYTSKLTKIRQRHPEGHYSELVRRNLSADSKQSS